MAIDPDVVEFLRPIQEHVVAIQAGQDALQKWVEALAAQPQADALLSRIEALEARPGTGRSEAVQTFWEAFATADNRLNSSDALYEAMTAAIRGMGQ